MGHTPKKKAFSVTGTRIARGFSVWAVGSLTLWLSGCATFEAGRVQPKSDSPADLVIVGGRIWTGEAPVSPQELTGRQPTAVAIRKGIILDVGDDASMQRYVGHGTRLIDAGGRRIIPGITDSHLHLISGGFQLARLNLRKAMGREQFIGMVAAEALQLDKSEWVLGGRWSVESWAKPQSPTKAWIDPVTGGKPALLNRMDGHQALANSAALALAGIDRHGPTDPKGGEIERDAATGEPTGILKESAVDLVARHVPSPTPQRRYDALLRAMAHARSLGVTSVHAMCDLADINVFRRAEADGVMTIRVTGYLQVGDWSDDYDNIETAGLDSDVVRLAGFKGYMDGSLGSRTAYMREPYSDATPEMRYPRGQRTVLADSPERFRELVADADARGYQIAVHAIGDAANHELLDAYAYARNRNGSRDRYLRDEHAQHLVLSDIPRFAKLGVVASMQPYHKADDGRYAEKAIGKARLRGSYAYRQLVDSGALLIFGSDWPVVTLNPFKGIDSAVNARTLAGKVWLPSHSLTVAEALYAYTAAPPKAIGMENKLGTITPGKHADLLILDRDLFTIDKNRLGEVKPVMTIVGGAVVYGA